ncbi:MAG: acyl carrier protein [Eggerthellaceae bacterium]|nr:acyl carrier protein [Eggerthellaceae bacterium]
MTILENIKDILKEKQNIDPANLTENTTFKDLNIDSIDMIELVCELEDRIEKDLSDTPKYIENIGEFVSYVESL